MVLIEKWNSVLDGVHSLVVRLRSVAAATRVRFPLDTHSILHKKRMTCSGVFVRKMSGPE